MTSTRTIRLALRLVQAAATALERPRLDTGGIDFPPVDEDDDGNGGDDEEWSWGKLHVRFQTAMRNWVYANPIVNKIANMVYEVTFSKKPKIRIMVHQGGSTRKYGRLQMDIDWRYRGDLYEDFENEFEAILRKSDLYKVFRARPEQLWDILQKGDVLLWAIHQIYMAITGRVEGSQSPADKQAAFQLYDFVTKNKEKYDRWIQKRLNPGVPLRITVSRPITSYGQFYDNGFMAGGVVYWEYEPGEEVAEAG